MRTVRTFTLLAASLTVASFTLTLAGCKSETATPPNPVSIINNTRNQLTPFRFTLSTDPAPPRYNAPILLKVHVIDAANQAADGVALKADVSMTGMQHGDQHVMLTGRGNGDYEGPVNLEMAGPWDVELTATKDGKSGKQKMSIEVGG